MPSLPSISASAFWLTSVAQTCAPSRAKASAAPRPIPCPAAVMNAVLPASLPAMRGRSPEVLAKGANYKPLLTGQACRPTLRRVVIQLISQQVRMNKLDFSGRTAVVTGGVQGIGAAIVKRLKASGAEVIVWDLRSEERRVGKEGR